MEAHVLERIPKLAGGRRQRVADDRGYVRRPDEPSGPGGPVWRCDAEALVGEQHDAHVRGVLDRAGAWCLWAFKMGFGTPIGSGKGFFDTMWGKSGTVLGAGTLQAQAAIPSISVGPPFHFPEASLIYFQFVFAAITPILMLGSVLGRINFKAWIPFVLLWITFVYTINAFLIWGGGYWAAHGALDLSGGYVIHLAAGISGFVAAAVIGPRLQRDREIDAPNNLLMVAAGAGLLWLGWNGFNGGDSY